MGDDKVVPLELPDDGAFHDLVVDASKAPGWQGTVTKLRVRAFDDGQGQVALDYLRVAADPGGGEVGAGGAAAEGGAGPGTDDGSSGLSGHGTDESAADTGGGCGCEVPGARPPTSSSVAGVLTCLLLGVRLRRRARSASAAGPPRAPRRPDARTYLDARDD
jgi:hypothetical protein